MTERAEPIETEDRVPCRRAQAREASRPDTSGQRRCSPTAKRATRGCPEHGRALLRRRPADREPRRARNDLRPRLLRALPCRVGRLDHRNVPGAVRGLRVHLHHAPATPRPAHPPQRVHFEKQDHDSHREVGAGGPAGWGDHDSRPRPHPGGRRGDQRHRPPQGTWSDARDRPARLARQFGHRRPPDDRRIPVRPPQSAQARRPHPRGHVAGQLPLPCARRRHDPDRSARPDESQSPSASRHW